VSADADQAAADFELLKSTSLELGVGLSTLSDGYRKIGIGARAANINLEDTREILLSGAEAATAFGLDAEQANLVLLAMGQIISKGRVSREELGRQMGEQFPAMIIGAEAMNMELAEFERLVESGGLSAKEFIVPFAKELRATVRETGALQAGLESVRAEIGRFQGQMQIAVDEVFSGGMRESTALIIKQLTAVLTTYAPIIKTLGAAIVGLTIAVSGILNGIGKVFAPLFEGLNIIIGKVAELLGLVSGDGDSLVTGFETLGVVIGIVAAIWGASSLVTGVGWLVTKGLPAMISLWETVRILMLEISILNAFATSGASIALGAAALAGVGLVAAIGVNSLYGGSDDSGATTTSTDKSTNTTIERLEVNVTAPAGADANQFGQHVADSMAASMGLSSAITN
jgi:tape measure domain-containing protein